MNNPFSCFSSHDCQWKLYVLTTLIVRAAHSRANNYIYSVQYMRVVTCTLTPQIYSHKHKLINNERTRSYTRWSCFLNKLFSLNNLLGQYALHGNRLTFTRKANSETSVHVKSITSCLCLFEIAMFEKWFPESGFWKAAYVASEAEGCLAASNFVQLYRKT